MQEVGDRKRSNNLLVQMVDIVELNELVVAKGCDDLDELDMAKNHDELDDLIVAKSLDELNELIKLNNQLEVGNRYQSKNQHKCLKSCWSKLSLQNQLAHKLK
jgi:hypothetical protein